jgi:uncharacterized protein YwqG
LNANLHPALLPYADALARSRKTFNQVSFENSVVERWQSKLGGQPWLPLGSSWPVTDHGKALTFLAQINFAEMPPLDGFPAHGIVQFFIFGDDFYGANFDSDFGEDALSVQRHFRVIHWPNVNAEATQAPVKISANDSLPFDPETEYAMLFEAKDAPMSSGDVDIKSLLGTDLFHIIDEYAKANGVDDGEVGEEVFKCLEGMGHKVGGYPGFTQTDPRNENTEYILLFQLDTDDDVAMMWGDVGIANFFIPEDNLRRGDFSRVMYNWDCC